VDFDDLIRLPVELFKTQEEALQRWQRRFRYLLVDEYQDTNDCQYQMMKLLAGDRAAITAVGDDDQAIYAWRGASTANIHNLQKDYPTLRVIKLEQNYRSSQRISRWRTIDQPQRGCSRKSVERSRYRRPGAHLRGAHDEHEPSVVMKLMAQSSTSHRFADYAIYTPAAICRAPSGAVARARCHTVSGGASFRQSRDQDITAYRVVANTTTAGLHRAIPERSAASATRRWKLGSYAGTRQISLFGGPSRRRWAAIAAAPVRADAVLQPSTTSGSAPKKTRT
jgi:ATP-dependent DNA helicase Rep